MKNIVINLILASVAVIFHPDLKSLIGDKFLYIAIPIVFSIFFFLIDKKSKINSFNLNFIISFILFVLVYLAFNYSQNNFRLVDFVFSLLITVVYVYFQKKVFFKSESER
jgi:hypothetical protein